jgi:tetratricopeptide (TPR) repeat protein
MSETTARQVVGMVEIEDAGEHAVKGVSKPLKLSRLLGVSDESPVATPQIGEHAELVGRDDELAELISALDRLETGTGSLIGIVGSPGLGKSRLCSELVDHCERRGLPVFSTRCQAHTRDVSLNPLLRLLRGFFAIDSTDPPELSRQKVAERLLVYDSAFESVLPVVYDFIGIRDPELSPPDLSPEARKRRLMAAIGQISRARTDPVVLVVEDLHWSDPESQAFFDLLADSTADSKTLFIGTFRPEFNGGLLARPFYRQIPLAPLGDSDIQSLLRTVIGNDPSADGLAEMVADRSAGNPFFAEEIVRDLAEAGSIEGRRGGYELAASIGSLGTPSSVQAVLGARIDRLDAASKAVLMTASVIGDEFRYDLLAETVDVSDSELASALHELIQSEFIKETELFPVARYSFRHPLTHEVAYESQLTSVRAEIHARIAVAMQSIDVERLEENAAIVAQHFEAAGDSFNSATWHARAATWAMTTDPVAAYESLWRVKRLSRQAIDEGHDAGEIYATALWMLLATGWRNGVERSLIEPIFEEACEIAERNGDDDYLTRVCAAYASSTAFVNGDFPEAARLGVKAYELSRTSDDRLVRLAGQMARPYSALNVARFSDALAGCDAVLEEVTDDPDFGSFLLGASPAAFFYGARGIALTELGRCTEARESQAKARAVAEKHSKVTQTWTHIYNFWAISLGRDVMGPADLRDAEEAFALGDEVGDVFTRSTAYICGGAAYLAAGDLPRALAVFEQAAEFFDGSVSIKNTEAFLDQLRGDALCSAGDFENGLNLSRRAVDRADDYGYEVSRGAFRIAHSENLIRSGELADLADAARHLRDAERLLAGSENKIDWIPLRRVRALLHEANGDQERADQERGLAIAMARKMDARGHLALLGEPVTVG